MEESRKENEHALVIVQHLPFPSHLPITVKKVKSRVKEQYKSVEAIQEWKLVGAAKGAERLTDRIVMNGDELQQLHG